MNLHLSLVARIHLLGGAVAACVGGIVWGAPGTLAAIAGALLGGGNLWVIRRLARQAVATAEHGGGEGAGRLVAGLFLKMLALFALAWLAVGVFRLGVMPFALGFLAMVVALLAAGERGLAHRETPRTEMN